MGTHGVIATKRKGVKLIVVVLLLLLVTGAIYYIKHTLDDMAKDYGFREVSTLTLPAHFEVRKGNGGFYASYYGDKLDTMGVEVVSINSVKRQGIWRLRVCLYNDKANREADDGRCVMVDTEGLYNAGAILVVERTGFSWRVFFNRERRQQFDDIALSRMLDVGVGTVIEAYAPPKE
jgi:hypothetical protein